MLGRHSGLHGFRKRLGELGLSLTDEEAKKAYERFLEIADRKKEVYDDDLYVIVSDQLGEKSETLPPGLLQHPVGQPGRAHRHGAHPHG